MSKDKTKMDPTAADIGSESADKLRAENDALRAELAELKARASAPATVPTAPGSLWRVALRHTPVGAAARRNRTVPAATADEAWAKFVELVRADLKKGTGKASQKALAQFEEWLGQQTAGIPLACEITSEETAKKVLADLHAIAKG